MARMEMTVDRRRDVTVMSLAGELGVEDAEAFRKLMDDLLAGGAAPRAVLDISGATRFASYAVALIGHYNARFREARGRLVLTGAAGAARRALELSGVAATLETAASVDEALEKLTA
jgi:anti-anti-sigma factor